MDYKSIPKFPKAYYRVDITWDYLERCLYEQWDDPKTPLVLNPEWQRGHVWTELQQIAFVEYCLRGGSTGREIYFNCSSWQGKYNTPIYCVDGLQRITAALDFMKNKIAAFGSFYREFTNLGWSDLRFSANMLSVRNKRELLQVYYDFNAGGTPHSSEEINRIAKMIRETDPEENV